MKKAFLIIIFTILSCDNNKVNNNIEVNLKFKNTQDNFFFEQIKPLGIEKDTTNFIGIPKNLDYWMIFKMDNHELYNHDQLYDELMKTPQYTYVLSGKKNTNIIMIIDKNNDKNFSNDENIIFKNLIGLPRNQMTKSREVLEAPIYEIKESDLKLRIFPFPNYFTSTNSEYFVQNELQIVFTPLGYWQGEFQINNNFFKVALHKGLPKNKSQILFSKIKDTFDLIFNEDYFPYNELDMVNLNNSNFLIQPQNLNDSILKLNYRVSSDSIGLHKGFYLENYPIQLINNGNKKNIDSLLKTKRYLILDFWGTWCSPCIELIPEVKKIIVDFKNVQVLGIALDSREELVDSFIRKNDINYPNHFISYEEADDNNSVIQKQRITNYPYYILIDKNRKIIYRGTGKKALDKIKIEISQK